MLKRPGSEFSRALAACLDSEAGRRVLAKDLAGPDIAPQSRNGLVTRLAHDDELAHAVHRRLGHAACAERVPAERINIQFRPELQLSSGAFRSSLCAGRAAIHDRISEPTGRPGLLESRPGRATAAARGPGKYPDWHRRADPLPFRRSPGPSSTCGR